MDKELIGSHPIDSVRILKNNLSFTDIELELIKNHHKIVSDKFDQLHSDIVYGLETLIVSVVDILVAMTSDRPYRKRYTFYEALEYIKKLLADGYPKEFKGIVLFVKSFFN